MPRLVSLFVSILLIFSFKVPTVFAIVDPLGVPNNKFGIHITTPDETKIKDAAEMVNSNGDWGYVTLVIESRDRDLQKWQDIFNSLRRNRLIPLVRIATYVEKGYWTKPKEGEEEIWADFLNKLIWPTKNRYVIIYNEPNHASEWGNAVNAAEYAYVLEKTITELKRKSEDFFILNAGFDASAPQKLPIYQDQLDFMNKMSVAIPGIFNRLDGWVSHSYPNPGFIGSPKDEGRGSIRTWEWELEVLKSLGVAKSLPVFIAETGWRHSEGLRYNQSYPKPEKVSEYLKEAFETTWRDKRIAAVTPFLIEAQDEPFDYFSFKKVLLGKNASKYRDYYPHYYTLQELQKEHGMPFRENKAMITNEGIYSKIAIFDTYTIPVKVKNIGHTIWGEEEQIKLVATETDNSLFLKEAYLPSGVKIEPSQEYVFNINLKANELGKFKISLQLFSGNEPFLNEPFIYETEVKTPVYLQINAKLKWKDDSSGDNYILEADDYSNDIFSRITLDSTGTNGHFQIPTFLPDRIYKLTLHRQFYKSKTIVVEVKSGNNVLDFGELQPDFFSALMSPRDFWRISPFSD
jgi:hypothetical protein